MEDKKYPKTTYWDEDGIYLSPEDASVVLIESIDIHSQLIAIYETFKWIESLKKEQADEIKKLEDATKKPQNENLPFTSVDFLVDQYHQSVYVDAANSMSTIGMIAPTLESVLYEIFNKIGQKFKNPILSESSSRLKLDENKRFDCHLIYSEKSKKGFITSLTKGIIELSQDTGLQSYLPSDFPCIVDAIFSYRNKIFHNGLEWPESERINFQKKIDNSNWPVNWFSKAQSDDTPWFFYMTDTFQSLCMKTLNDIIMGAGKFVIDFEEKMKVDQF